MKLTAPDPGRPTALRLVESIPAPERLVYEALLAARLADGALERTVWEIDRAVSARRKAADLLKAAGIPPGHEVVVRELADGTAIAEAAVGRLAALLGIPQSSRVHGGPSLERYLQPSFTAVRDACCAYEIDQEGAS